MPTIEPDYLKLWHDLAMRASGQFVSRFDGKNQAEAYESASRRKNQGKQDSLLDFVKSALKPEDTVLDIGAGTGRWAVPIARVVSRLTAVEPSGAMSDILMAKAAEAGVADRIDLVPATWEEAEASMHDITICFHAMYMSADLAFFVRKMDAHARRRCYMGIRHFPINGVIQELCTNIYGSRHDSPNFIVAYNALYQMGIYANVLMEEQQQIWKDTTLESAFARAKRHLHLDEENATYDALVRTTLQRRLESKDGEYWWPDAMSTAMVWWDAAPRAVEGSSR